VKHLLEVKNNYITEMEQNARIRLLVESILSTELISSKAGNYDVANIEAFSGSNEHA